MKYYVESYLSYLYKKVIVSRAGHDISNFLLSMIYASFMNNIITNRSVALKT